MASLTIANGTIDLRTGKLMPAQREDYITKGLKVDGATVNKPDVRASNGVIHIIDTVLMPK